MAETGPGGCRQTRCNKWHWGALNRAEAHEADQKTNKKQKRNFATILKAALNIASPTCRRPSWQIIVFSVALSLNIKTRPICAQTFVDLSQKCISPFVFILTAVIWWVPQHPLMIQLVNGIFSLFLLSGSSVFFVVCRSRRIALDNGRRPGHGW